jgi:hypothetical protein
MTPDLTLILQESPEEIQRRMNIRINNLNSDAVIPVVWRQSKECFARIMQEFRDHVTDSEQ